MKRRFLNLVVVFLAYLAIPATLDAQDARDYYNRGDASYRDGNYDMAISAYDQALAIDSSYAAAYNNRGAAWDKKGEYGRAIADYGQALRLDPNLACAYRNLAWLYATCREERYRDGRRAVENATRACQLSEGKNWDHIDTLAAAYAQSGDFERARLWQAKAIELAPDEQCRQGCRSRLDLYAQGKTSPSERQAWQGSGTYAQAPVQHGTGTPGVPFYSPYGVAMPYAGAAPAPNIRTPDIGVAERERFSATAAVN
jgi:tetratricopeptide (TPR) repeat protein